MRERWEILPFGEVCEISGGSQPPKSNFIYEPKDGYIRLVQVRDYRTDKFITYIPKDKAKKFCSATDIMIGRYGPPIFGIFDGIEGAYNVALMKAIPNEQKLNKEYFKWFLKSDNLIKFVEKTSKRAAGQDGVRKERLYTYPVPIPPLEEQKEIATLLDQAFTAIDQAKVNIEKNIENAKELFQSKLNNIFSQKGDGWEEKTLGEVCKNLDSKRIPITKSKRESGEIPYYGASGIVDYVADYIFDEDLLLVSEDGANLLARTYPIAFSISGKTWVNNHAHALKFQSMTSQVFIEYYLNSIKLDGFISGMAQPKLNQRMLNSIPVPFPSIEIQKKVVFIVEKLNNQISNVTSQYKQKIDSLEELKKSILQKAFTGELTQTKEDFLTAEQKHALLITLSYSRHRNAGTELTFGHTKSEKMIHLFENYAGINLDRNPIKDAAGPNDFPRTRQIIEPLAKENKYFYVEEEKERYTYSFAANSFKGIKKLEKEFRPLQRKRVEQIISLFINEKTEQSELYATIYAAWNNLLIRNENITDELIVQEARENWHQNKLKIERSKFFETITKLRTNNIIPEGNGKLVEKKTLF